MNILVLGNGFDLAHNLPTSYSDFLKFCKELGKIATNGNEGGLKRNLPENLSDSVINELFAAVESNIWLKYFWRRSFSLQMGKNWIDFEVEIAKVIQNLDKARHAIKEGQDISAEAASLLHSIISTANYQMSQVLCDVKSLDNFTHFLYTELEKMIRILEIYIAEIIGKTAVQVKSADIEALNPDHVLSFNYSNTYERLYGQGQAIEYDYIHGKADIENSITSNNMVLGIDEYLSDDKKDKETEFIVFKKYYQRIYKQSKRLAEAWCESIRADAEYETRSRKFMLEEQIGYELVDSHENFKYSWSNYERLVRVYEEEYAKNHPKHNLYIFGHSLDVTDKDILRKLILNENVHTTIFYCKKKDSAGNYDNGKRDLGKKIENLVKVIGQDELIRKTGGSNRTIEFQLQSDMVLNKEA